MKKFNRTWLQEEIFYNGEHYNCNHRKSAELSSKTLGTIKKELSEEGKKCILVNVLSSNLKGKTDLHGQPYKPTTWIYTNV